MRVFQGTLNPAAKSRTALNNGAILIIIHNFGVLASMPVVIEFTKNIKRHAPLQCHIRGRKICLRYPCFYGIGI
ncbi:hypothetical protein [Desulfosarcina cetonica]